MATVQVLSATGFFSDDLFGPATALPTSVASNSTSQLFHGFDAYGTASTNTLVVTYDSVVTPTIPHTGTYTSILARAGATDLASVSFSTPVPVTWTNTLGAFWNSSVCRAANPLLPSTLFGGTDTMTGNAGNDVFFGYGGDDTLTGLGGSDTLLGGGGDDTLTGGTGPDNLVGGAGNDTFVVTVGDTTGDRIYGGETDGSIGAGEINTILLTGPNSFVSLSISQI